MGAGGRGRGDGCAGAGAGAHLAERQAKLGRGRHRARHADRALAELRVDAHADRRARAAAQALEAAAPVVRGQNRVDARELVEIVGIDPDARRERAAQVAPRLGRRVHHDPRGRKAEAQGVLKLAGRRDLAAHAQVARDDQRRGERVGLHRDGVSGRRREGLLDAEQHLPQPLEVVEERAGLLVVEQRQRARHELALRRRGRDDVGKLDGCAHFGWRRVPGYVERELSARGLATVGRLDLTWGGRGGE